MLACSLLLLLHSNRCMFVDCLSSVSFLCAPADTLGDDASLRSTTPSESSSQQVRGDYIMLYSFQLALPRYRIERLLDPTTLYSCLSNKPKQPCSPHPSKPCTAMLLLLAAQPLLSMHARMLSTFPLLLLGLGYHVIIIAVDDMIIIILTISDEGWKV